MATFRGLTAHYFFTFGVSVQPVGERRNTKAEDRVLQLDVNQSCLKLIRKSVVRTTIKLDNLHQVIWDSKEPRSVLVSCKDDRRLLVDFQSAEDTAVFRMAYADMAAARLDMARYHRQVLIKGMLMKRGRSTGTFQERFVVVTPQKMFVLASKVAVFPSNVLSLAATAPRLDDMKGTLHIEVLGHEFTFRAPEREDVQVWYSVLLQACGMRMMPEHISLPLPDPAAPPPTNLAATQSLMSPGHPPMLSGMDPLLIGHASLDPRQQNFLPQPALGQDSSPLQQTSPADATQQLIHAPSINTVFQRIQQQQQQQQQQPPPQHIQDSIQHQQSAAPPATRASAAAQQQMCPHHSMPHLPTGYNAQSHANSFAGAPSHPLQQYLDQQAAAPLYSQPSSNGPTFSSPSTSPRTHPLLHIPSLAPTTPTRYPQDPPPGRRPRETDDRWMGGDAAASVTNEELNMIQGDPRLALSPRRNSDPWMTQEVAQGPLGDEVELTNPVNIVTPLRVNNGAPVAANLTRGSSSIAAALGHQLSSAMTAAGSLPGLQRHTSALGTGLGHGALPHTASGLALPHSASGMGLPLSGSSMPLGRAGTMAGGGQSWVQPEANEQALLEQQQLLVQHQRAMDAVQRTQSELHQAGTDRQLSGQVLQLLQQQQNLQQQSLQQQQGAPAPAVAAGADGGASLQQLLLQILHNQQAQQQQQQVQQRQQQLAQAQSPAASADASTPTSPALLPPINPQESPQQQQQPQLQQQQEQEQQQLNDLRQQQLPSGSAGQYHQLQRVMSSAGSSEGPPSRGSFSFSLRDGAAVRQAVARAVAEERAAERQQQQQEMGQQRSQQMQWLQQQQQPQQQQQQQPQQQGISPRTRHRSRHDQQHEGSGRHGQALPADKDQSQSNGYAMSSNGQQAQSPGRHPSHAGSTGNFTDAAEVASPGGSPVHHASRGYGDSRRVSGVQAVHAVSGWAEAAEQQQKQQQQQQQQQYPRQMGSWSQDPAEVQNQLQQGSWLADFQRLQLQQQQQQGDWSFEEASVQPARTSSDLPNSPEWQVAQRVTDHDEWREVPLRGESFWGGMLEHQGPGWGSPEGMGIAKYGSNLSGSDLNASWRADGSNSRQELFGAAWEEPTTVGVGMDDRYTSTTSPRVSDTQQQPFASTPPPRDHYRPAPYPASSHPWQQHPTYPSQQQRATTIPEPPSLYQPTSPTSPHTPTRIPTPPFPPPNSPNSTPKMPQPSFRSPSEVLHTPCIRPSQVRTFLQLPSTQQALQRLATSGTAPNPLTDPPETFHHYYLCWLLSAMASVSPSPHPQSNPNSTTNTGPASSPTPSTAPPIPPLSPAGARYRTTSASQATYPPARHTDRLPSALPVLSATPPRTPRNHPINTISSTANPNLNPDPNTWVTAELTHSPTSQDTSSASSTALATTGSSAIVTIGGNSSPLTTTPRCIPTSASEVVELCPDISSVLPGMTLVLRIKKATTQLPPATACLQSAAAARPMAPIAGSQSGGQGWTPTNGPSSPRVPLVSNAARELLQVPSVANHGFDLATLLSHLAPSPSPYELTVDNPLFGSTSLSPRPSGIPPAHWSDPPFTTRRPSATGPLHQGDSPSHLLAAPGMARQRPGVVPMPPVTFEEQAAQLLASFPGKHQVAGRAGGRSGDRRASTSPVHDQDRSARTAPFITPETSRSIQRAATAAADAVSSAVSEALSNLKRA